MYRTPSGTGWIEVIAGCMFSGKTEELIRRIRRAQYGRQTVVVFKPRIDDRYSVDSVGSHSGTRLRSIQVDSSADIRAQVGAAQVVGIDEAQFLDDALVDLCEELANEGRRVIVAGLDLDFRGEPFGPMPRLLCKAEYIQKAHAVCVICGNPADRSQRLVAQSDTVLVGESDSYEARCRIHWDPNAADGMQQRLPFGPDLAELT